MEELELIPGYDHPQEMVALFQEYTRMLVENNSSFQQYLDLQNYEAEIRDLELKYGPPGGRLYLARCGGEAVGCIALRRLDEQRGELKRLYVRPAYRGRGFATTLVRRIIQDAREAGYTQLLLDTEPFLQAALRIYKGLGFYEIPCYNDSPLDTTIFLQLDL